MALSSEKLLNEFAIRLNKQRAQMTDACSQVDALRKEAANLQRQLDLAQQEQEDANRQHDDLSEKYNEMKAGHD